MLSSQRKSIMTAEKNLQRPFRIPSDCGSDAASSPAGQLRLEEEERKTVKKNTLPCYQKIAVVIVNCNLGPTEHLGVHGNLLKRVRALLIELEFGSVGF